MNNENELTAALATIEKCREIIGCPEGVDLQDHLRHLAAENVGLKANLMFWDADNPELPYDSPEEIASECELNYNDELVVQVAAKLPNRTYRVCESWESDCKLELVESADIQTPATDRIYDEAEARGVEKLIEHLVNNGYDSVANGVKAYMQLREGAK